MNLLLTIGICCLSFIISFVSWYIALRRILGLQRLEVTVTCVLVWVEELLPFIVLGNIFIVEGLWAKIFVALSAATGATMGALILMLVEKRKKKNENKIRSSR